jgi:hypothetical protein
MRRSSAAAHALAALRRASHPSCSLIAMLSVLGYSRRSILLAYLVPGVVLFVVGNLLGILASWGSMWTFASAYANAVGMPTPVLNLDHHQVFTAMLVIATSVMIGVILPMRSLLQISAIEALSESTATADAMPVGTQASRRLPGPFWLQYTVRNLLRQRGLSTLSVMTIGASLAVPIALYMCLTSTERTAAKIRLYERKLSKVCGALFIYDWASA